MNIVEQQPCCPACGESAANQKVVSCGSYCLRVSAKTFVNACTHEGKEPQLHFHITCMNCEFQWLEKVPAESEARTKKAW